MKLFRLMTAVVILASFTFCQRDQSESKISDRLDAISDTLNAGNLAEAVRMTEEIKMQALLNGDSSTWSKAMIQQGVNAYYQRNPERLIASADTAIKWLVRQKQTPELARDLAKAYQTYGAYYDQFYFNPDSTAKYLRKSIDNVEKSGIVNDLPQAYGNYANAMRMGASLDSAALYYHRAITVADSLKLGTVHYIPLYNGIASVFSDLRDFENSEKWWRKSMDILDSMNQFDKFNTLTGYGNLLYYHKDYKRAEEIFSRLRNMLDSIPGAEWESMFTDVNLADTYLRLGHFGKATPILDITSVYFSEKQPNPIALSYIHSLQIKAAMGARDFKKANLLASRHHDEDTMRFEQRLARLKVLEELFSQTGDFHKAYGNRIIHDQLEDSLRSYRMSQQSSAHNAIYIRDKRVLSLESDNTRQQAHIYRLLAVIAFSIAVIVALILFFVVRRNNQRRREERMMKKIFSLRQENLRNRVTPHFIYNALNHELHNKNSGNPSHLDALVRLIRRQQTVASELLIPFQEELNFVEDYIKVIGDNGRDTLNYTYSIDDGVSPDFLFPAMGLQILVENAFKHGFASLSPGAERRLYIKVRNLQDKRIEVTVFNNRGAEDTETNQGGTGLRVLLETIRLIKEINHKNIEFSVNPNAVLDGTFGYSATITLIRV